MSNKRFVYSRVKRNQFVNLWLVGIKIALIKLLKNLNVSDKARRSPLK